jgi:hypothetical protein
MTKDEAIVAEEISVLMTTTVRYDGGEVAPEGEILTVQKDLAAIWIRKGWAVEVKGGRKKKG